MAILDFRTNKGTEITRKTVNSGNTAFCKHNVLSFHDKTWKANDIHPLSPVIPVGARIIQLNMWVPTVGDHDITLGLIKAEDVNDSDPDFIWRISATFGKSGNTGMTAYQRSDLTLFIAPANGTDSLAAEGYKFLRGVPMPVNARLVLKFTAANATATSISTAANRVLDYQDGIVGV